MISAEQIEQFWCLDNYELFVSVEKQLADPLFSSYSVVLGQLKSLQLSVYSKEPKNKVSW